MKNFTLGWIDLFFNLFFFLLKHFLRLHTKLKLRKKKKKEKKNKNTHTYIVQIEEYQAKHTHKAITAIQLPRMQITMPSL